MNRSYVHMYCILNNIVNFNMYCTCTYCIVTRSRAEYNHLIKYFILCLSLYFIRLRLQYCNDICTVWFFMLTILTPPPGARIYSNTYLLDCLILFSLICFLFLSTAWISDLFINVCVPAITFLWGDDVSHVQYENPICLCMYCS